MSSAMLEKKGKERKQNKTKEKRRTFLYHEHIAKLAGKVRCYITSLV